MKSSHTAAATFAAADDSNLIAYGGLAAGYGWPSGAACPGWSVTGFASPGRERCGHGAGREGDVSGGGHARRGGQHRRCGCAAARSDVPRVLRIRAPSTLGTFLRAFTWGHVRQLESAARVFTANLVRHCALLPGADQLVFLDIDSKVKPVHGYAKQGAAFGYTGSAGCTSRS